MLTGCVPGRTVDGRFGCVVPVEGRFECVDPVDGRFGCVIPVDGRPGCVGVVDGRFGRVVRERFGLVQTRSRLCTWVEGSGGYG